MRIDSMTHVTPDGRWLNTDYDAGSDRLLKEMDEARIEKSLIVPIAGFIENDFVLKTCDEHSDRFIPAASINPASYGNEEDAVKGIQKLAASGFRALKLHPRCNGYDPLDKRCLAILEELSTQANPFPIWLDTFLYSGNLNLKMPLVDTIRELALRFKKLTFVLLHSAGPWALQLYEATRSLPNTYMDLSYSLVRYKDTSLWSDFAYLTKYYDRRILFGSDFPEIGLREAYMTLEKLCEGLAKEKVENIFENNLTKILSE